MPNRIKEYGRLGFSDPYHTGLVCAIVETLRGSRMRNLYLDYVFEQEVLECEIIMEGRIFAVYLVFIAIRLFINKSTRKMIFN